MPGEEHTGGRRAVTLFIRSLNVGGAERQLVNLAVTLRRRDVPVEVLTFYSGGALRLELAREGVPVTDLGKRGRWDVLPFLYRLFRHLRRRRPAVLYSFLPMANIVAVSVAAFVPGTRVVWGVRASNMDLDRYDALSRLAFRSECRLSRRADLIIANSGAGKRYHVERGFPEQRVVVIPNGIDVDRFARTDAGRRAVRAEWGLAEDEIVIGLVARIDPMKDHRSFLEAAARLSMDHDTVRFACVGEGPALATGDLRALADRLGLGGKVIWAGARQDMANVYSALDVIVSSSYGEGFSNVIAEAMACEVPCIVTDVGDSAWIVGDTGDVVPARNAEALRQAMAVLAARSAPERAAIGVRARARVASHFSVETLADRTLSILGVVSRRQPDE
jgi:glycosyltransferase involved in cell wall biosynthesis